MPSLLDLPVETLEHVFLFLQASRDLLHVALSCKRFYGMIILTYHLHFANISCSLRETPPKFWEKLSTSTRLCSMVRQVETFGDFFPRSTPSLGFIIDEEFVTRWASIRPSWLVNPYPPPECIFRAFIQCLANFDRCHSIVLRGGPHLEQEYSDLLSSISANRSANLQTLVLKYVCPSRLSVVDYVPCFTLSSFPFSGLTTFNVKLELIGHYLHGPIKQMLDSVVFDCSTIVEFSFTLYHRRKNVHFTYFPLMEHAYWPSLESLELGGASVQLFTTEERNVDTYINFLDRHTRIGYLSFDDLGDNEVKTLQTRIPPHMLPHLRALDSSFPLHPDIFTRSQHISNLQIYPSDTFLLARSLRSCVIDVGGVEWTIIDEIIEAIPQLERLCVCLSTCWSESCRYECRCIFKYNLYRITELRNLTHLGLLAILGPEEEEIRLWRRLINRLPRLDYVYKYYHLADPPVLYHVVRNIDQIKLEQSEDIWEFLPQSALVSLMHCQTKPMNPFLL